MGIAYWIDSFLSALLGEVDACSALDGFGALLSTDLTGKVAVGLGLHDFPYRVIVAVKHGRAGEGVGKEAHHYYGNDGDSFEAQIPYKIEIFYAKPGFQLVMMYESDIVEETTWGEYEVTKLVNHNPYWGDDNYVLLFSPDNGYMIRVGGGLDMETMEKIAQNLEVRILDEEVEYNPDYNIGIINVGRG